MHINKIKLENFRNYEEQEIDLVNGINLFLGDNAQGKTNIIEAIYICAFGKSYRTIKDNELIMFNKDFCKIDTRYTKNGRELSTQFYIDNLNRKQLKNNEIKIKKIADYVGEIPIVIFSPESLDVVKGSPAKRRNFIDMICCQLSKSYIIYHQEYMKCLKLKNSMLKDDYVDDNYIEVLHEKMSKYIKEIVGLRNKIINMLNQYAIKIQSSITNGKENINLVYNTDFLNMDEKEIKKYLDEHLYIDKLRFSSIKGIQRDDIEIFVNEKEVSKFGSQGQKRTALLTLKLANFELLKDEKNEVPILLLDDIMSELDSKRISFLLKYIENYQSIITTTEDTFVKDIKNIKIYKVSNGRLEN
ncbi:MAG: DNA replication/repair protein RecF [Clostridia bacterium]